MPDPATITPYRNGPYLLANEIGKAVLLEVKKLLPADLPDFARKRLVAEFERTLTQLNYHQNNFRTATGNHLVSIDALAEYDLANKKKKVF